MYSEDYRRRLRREDAPSIIALGRCVCEEDKCPPSAGSGGAPNEDEATKTMEIVGTDPVDDQESEVGTMLPDSAAGTREETSPASAVGAADRACDHPRIPQEQDPPPAEKVEEDVRTGSVPIDVDTCIPWEQFDVKFGKLDTVDTFKTSSETSPSGNEDGDGWADESMPLAANDSRCFRCKSWAKHLAVFALGAVLGGVLVAHTPLGGGGSQTPAAVSSSTSTSSEYKGADQQEGLAENNEGGETPNLASLTNQNDTFVNSSRPEKEAEKGGGDESPDGYFGQNDGGMLDFLHDTFEEIIPTGESDSISPGDSAPSDDILTDDDREEGEGGDKVGTVEGEMILPIDESKTMDDIIDDATSNTTSAIDDDDLTYVPGDLSQLKKGLLLSRGLDVAIIAQSDRPVVFANGTHSKLNFHGNPDFGATFAYPDDDQSNPGAYVYVSNAEIKHSEGGVGALTFDKNGGIIDYKMLLQGTSMNCGGGEFKF